VASNSVTGKVLGKTWNFGCDHYTCQKWRGRATLQTLDLWKENLPGIWHCFMYLGA